eukprot:m.70487 g.70487  ORF g.70487 m.70487 type:complete len:1891 (-) comp12891_c1_seq1:30-5702(-)
MSDKEKVAEGGQRRFVGLLNKDQSAHAAREQQRQNVTRMLMSSPEAFPEPLDFEEEITRLQEQINTDPMRDLLTFPEDDWHIKEEPRKHRSELHPLAPDTPEHIRQTAQTYTRNWVVVERRYAAHAQHPLRRPDDHARGLGDLNFPCDQTSSDTAADPRVSLASAASALSDVSTLSASLTADELLRESEDPILGMLKFTPGETDKAYFKARQAKRLPFIGAMSYHTHAGENVPVSRLGDEVLPLHDPVRQRYLFSCVDFQFKVEVFEPMFCSMALYSLTEANTLARISENFYFDFNREEVASLLAQNASHMIAGTRAHRAVLAVDSPENVYALIRIEKVLEGEVARAAEPYFKEERKEDKVREAKTAAKQLCERLGRFRMPLAFALVSLAEALEETGDVLRTDMYLWQPEKLREDDIVKLLVDMKNPLPKRSRLRNYRKFPGSFQYQLRPIGGQENIPNSLTPSFARVLPFDEAKQAHLSVEVAEFPLKPIYLPHASLRHHLYVYPLTADLRPCGANVRNICCRVELLDRDGTRTANVQGLPCVFPRNPFAPKVTSATTAVAHHERSPEFHEEIKIQLPERLTDKHHLLFTFFHVGCKDKGEAAPPKQVAHAWINIGVGDRFNRAVDLPLCSELPSDYLSLSLKSDSGDTKQFLDNKRPLFRVFLRLDSTVLPGNVYIDKFLNPVAPRGGGPVRHLPLLLRNLRDQADKAELVHFLGPVLDELLRKMVSDPERTETFLTLLHVVHVVQEHSPSVTTDTTRRGRHASRKRDGQPCPDLQTYIKYAFDQVSGPGEIPLYEVLAEQLQSALAPDRAEVFTHAVQHVWFFLTLIAKSMMMHVWKSPRTPRKDRFSEKIMMQVESIVMRLYELMVKGSISPEIATEVNYAVALFERDLLSVADRGRSLRVIRAAFQTMHSREASEKHDIVARRLDALRILCTHEHFYALNLPLLRSDGDRQFLALTPDFCRAHYLIGLLLGEVCALLKTTSSHRAHAIHLVLDLLSIHDDDVRLNTLERKARMAALFIPLLSFLRDYDALAPPASSGDTATSPRRRESVRKAEVQLNLTVDETRNLLLLWMHVLKTIDVPTIRRWLRVSVAQDKLAILTNTHSCLRVFEYPGRIFIHTAAPKAVGFKEASEALYSRGGTGAAARRLHTRKVEDDRVSTGSVVRKHTSVADDSLLSPRNTAATEGIPRTYSNAHRAGGGVEHDEVATRLSANLSAEASITTLDLLELFIEEFGAELQATACRNELMETLFAVYLMLLETRQSTLVLVFLFASLQCFVNSFADLLFQGPTECCAELVERVFCHCSSPSIDVRQTAASFLYLLMRKNYEDKETGPAFSRVKVQALIALHKISSAPHFQYVFLLKSLATLISTAKKDRTFRDSPFPGDVEELALNLYKILVHTSQMKKYEADPEMTIDLYHRIAKGYTNSPDLRLQTLLNMAEKHEGRNPAEAAQCYVHAAALIAEHLHSMEVQPGMPKGCSVFDRIAPNVLEESAVSDDIQRLSLDKEGICTHKHFDREGRGIIFLLNHAITCFKSVGLFECVNEVYRVLLPIYEAKYDYALLEQSHKALAEIFRQIQEATDASKRHPAAFFRVGFFGDLFDTDLRGAEYIYKMPPLFRLAEMCQHIKSLYSEQFGEARVELLTDSKEVDDRQLEPGRAYLQVTSVEPHFSEHELKRRVKFFEQNMNVKQFMFETPFTIAGGARGRIEDQWKRRTFLTVDQSFPYLTRRLLVTEKREQELKPLEVALESIDGMTRKLTGVITARPLDIKMLQLRLQGSVFVAVNEGPLELANAFLNPAALSKHDPKQIKALRQAFARFLKACKDALDLNCAHLMHNQAEYHETLKAAEEKMREQLQPLLSGAAPASAAASAATRQNKLAGDVQESSDA